jgi:putative endopeptidase
MLTLLLALTLARPAGAASLSSFDPTAIDAGVAPCDDFYRHACGGWMKANPIPADQSRWGRFNELAERNKELLRGLLEKAAAGGAERTPSEKRMGDLYAACMDEEGIEKLGTDPLKPALDEVEALKDVKGLPKLLASLNGKGLPGPFYFDSDQDAKDATKVVAAFDQSGLTLPDRDYYFKQDPKSVQLRGWFEWHLAKMLGLMGATPAQAAKDAATIVRLETALAAVSMDRVSRRDPVNVYHPMKTAELEALAPGFGWAEYLAATGAPKSPWLVVSSTSHAKGFAALAASEPLEDWKTYLRWRVLAGSASQLPKAFVEESFDFGGRKLSGAKELKPRWKRCVELVDGRLGHDLGRRYYETTFGEEGRARMAELIAALRVAMRKDIESLDWMTPATKRKALAKLATFEEKIGGPKKWRAYEGVVIDRKDFMGSVRSAAAYERRRQLNKIGKPVDREEWGMTPPTVNAYYNPQLNQIVFPAGILQPPFFDHAGDPAFNFGGIGAVIGHEITHGFDDQGRKFDAKGNLADWWTEEDGKAFEAKASCIEGQYAGYEVLPGVKLNGKLTLGENTADNGGLRVARMAMAELPVKLGDVDGRTPDQRLFYGFAQIWCQNRTEAAARMLAQVDPHSAAEWRVNGTLSNMPEFAAAFGCKEGAKMVRAPACRVW